VVGKVVQSRVIKLPAISRNTVTVCMFLALSSCRLKDSYYKPGPQKHKALVGMTRPIIKQVCDLNVMLQIFFVYMLSGQHM